MMAFAELVSTDEAPEAASYIEHEVSCPFCEDSNWLSVSVDEFGTLYKCAVCKEEWAVKASG